VYEWMGRAHAALARERGQGTVEYVGLILVAATKDVGDNSIPKAIAGKLKATIDKLDN
jgi:hypothetical protein